MITDRDALKDLDDLIAGEDKNTDRIIKAFKVLIKFLSTIRSNQLLTENEKIEIKKNIINKRGK
jgi:intergrase/recombinase